MVLLLWVCQTCFPTPGWATHSQAHIKTWLHQTLSVLRLLICQERYTNLYTSGPESGADCLKSGIFHADPNQTASLKTPSRTAIFVIPPPKTHLCAQGAWLGAGRVTGSVSHRLGCRWASTCGAKAKVKCQRLAADVSNRARCRKHCQIFACS